MKKLLFGKLQFFYFITISSFFVLLPSSNVYSEDITELDMRRQILRCSYHGTGCKEIKEILEDLCSTTTKVGALYAIEIMRSNSPMSDADHIKVLKKILKKMDYKYENLLSADEIYKELQSISPLIDELRSMVKKSNLQIDLDNVYKSLFPKMSKYIDECTQTSMIEYSAEKQIDNCMKDKDYGSCALMGELLFQDLEFKSARKIYSILLSADEPEVVEIGRTMLKMIDFLEKQE